MDLAEPTTRNQSAVNIHYPEVHGGLSELHAQCRSVSGPRAEVFDRFLLREHLQPAFQPIVDLDTMATVAVEALARWPHLDATPEDVFRHAKEIGRLAELDSACQNASVDQAVAHPLPERFALFVNLEPSTISVDSVEQLVARAKGNSRSSPRSLSGRSPPDRLNS